MKNDDLDAKINELILRIQQLEQELDDLKNGNFGTGIYLDGCSEEDAIYINSKDEKVGV